MCRARQSDGPGRRGPRAVPDGSGEHPLAWWRSPSTQSRLGFAPAPRRPSPLVHLAPDGTESRGRCSAERVGKGSATSSAQTATRTAPLPPRRPLSERPPCHRADRCPNGPPCGRTGTRRDGRTGTRRDVRPRARVCPRRRGDEGPASPRRWTAATNRSAATPGVRDHASTPTATTTRAGHPGTSPRAQDQRDDDARRPSTMVPCHRPAPRQARHRLAGRERRCAVPRPASGGPMPTRVPSGRRRSPRRPSAERPLRRLRRPTAGTGTTVGMRGSPTAAHMQRHVRIDTSASKHPHRHIRSDTQVTGERWDDAG